MSSDICIFCQYCEVHILEHGRSRYWIYFLNSKLTNFTIGAPWYMPGIWPIGNVRAILNKPDDDKPGQMKAKPIVRWTRGHFKVVLRSLTAMIWVRKKFTYNRRFDRRRNRCNIWFTKRGTGLCMHRFIIQVTYTPFTRLLEF